MSDRLTDHQVGYLAALTIHPVCVLAREVQASRKLIADLRALHTPGLDEASVWCVECDPDCIDAYPCPTIRLIEEAGI